MNLGRKGKPFCGDCCCNFPKGSGNVNKRFLVRKAKRKEERDWRKEL